MGDNFVIKTIAFIGLGAAIALSPLAGFAQTAPAAPATHHATTHRPTGSYRSQMRHRHNLSKERARAGAEHVRTMPKQ